MKLVQRNVAIREDQDRMLLELAAKRQVETGESVSISKVMRDILDTYAKQGNGKEQGQ